MTIYNTILYPVDASNRFGIRIIKIIIDLAIKGSYPSRIVIYNTQSLNFIKILMNNTLLKLTVLILRFIIISRIYFIYKNKMSHSIENKNYFHRIWLR